MKMMVVMRQREGLRDRALAETQHALELATEKVISRWSLQLGLHVLLLLLLLPLRLPLPLLAAAETCTEHEFVLAVR